MGDILTFNAASPTDWTAILQTVFSGSLVVLTFFYVRTTNRQLKAMREALAEARDSNSTSERSLILGRRAWIVCTDAEEPTFSTTEDFIVNLKFRNTGGVPAIRVRPTAQWIGRNPFTLGDDYPPPEKSLRDASDIIGNGETYNVPMLVPPVTEEDLGRLKSCDQRFIIYGTVHYSDCFEKNWKTDFCIMWKYEYKMWVTLPYYSSIL